MSPVTIPIQRIRPAADLPLPTYASAGAAGLDLVADITEPQTLVPQARALVPTGVAIELPDGYEAQIRPRSGLALRYGVTLLNTPGTIDSDYRGEIAVILVNLGAEPYTVRRGDRIAQMVVAPVSRASWQLVTTLHSSDRGAGGFGHTGA